MLRFLLLALVALVGSALAANSVGTLMLVDNTPRHYQAGVCCNPALTKCYGFEDFFDSGGSGSRVVVHDVTNGVTAGAGSYASDVWSGNVVGCTVSMDGNELYISDVNSGKIMLLDLTSATPAAEAVTELTTTLDPVNGYYAYMVVAHPIFPGILLVGVGNAILKLDLNSGSAPFTPTLFAGDIAANGANDGTGAAAQFNTVAGGSFDRFGHALYVSDQFNDKIRVVSYPGAVVTTLCTVAIGTYPGDVVFDWANPHSLWSIGVNGNQIQHRRASDCGTVSGPHATGSTYGFHGAIAGEWLLYVNDAFDKLRAMYIGPHVPMSEADPHFIGFRGQRYDVLGHVNTTYLWYSDSDIQITGRLSVNPDDGKTYMTTAAIRFGGVATVELTTAPNYKAALFPFNETALDGCGRVYWIGRNLLVAQWHNYVIQLKTMTPIQGSRKYHHIDLSMSIKARNPETVHGLLGQTHRYSVPVPGGHEGEGVLEGVLADYEVMDGLFGTDTRFNRYKGEAGPYSAERCAKLLTSSKELNDLPMRGSFDGL